MELTRIAAQTASFLADVSLRSLLVFAAAGLACLLMRRASAAARHLVWSMTLLSLLLLPAFCLWLPRWNAPLLHRSEGQSAKTDLRTARSAAIARWKPSAVPPGGEAADGAGSKTSTSFQASAPSTAASEAVSPAAETASLPASASSSRPAVSKAVPRVTAAECLCLVWVLGCAAVLGRVALGLLGARRLLRGCRRVTEGVLVEAALTASRRLALSAPLILKAGTDAVPVAVPMTFGVVRPVVLMPEVAASWPAERLRVVLLHEAAHIKRMDWMTVILAQIVCAFYWFHPLVWLAASRLRVESEQACDDRVLGSGVGAVEYADHLVEVVRGLAGRRVSPTVVTMACRQEVTERLKMILAKNKNRRATGKRGVTLALLTMLCFLGPLAALRPVSATDPGQTNPKQSDAARPVSPHADPDLMSKFARMRQWEAQMRQIQAALLNAPASPWKVTLPNGIQVGLTELWALNGPDSNKFWTPGGRVLLTAKDGGTTPYYARFPSRIENIDVVVSFPSDALRKQARVSFGTLGGHLGNGTSLTDFNRNGYVLGTKRIIETGFQHSFAPSQAKADLVVSVATGPETVLVSGSPASGGSHRLPSGETAALTKATNTSKPGELQVTFRLPKRFVRDESQYKISVIDQNGQPFPKVSASQSYPAIQGKDAVIHYTLDAGKQMRSQIKEFHLTYRPSYTAVFRNAALRPAADASADHLHRIGQGIFKYAGDHSMHLPDAAHWMDQIIPYVVPAKLTGAARRKRIADLFHDPAAPTGQTWSYAYNRALSGLTMRQIDWPNRVVAAFESTQGIKNASGGPESVPRQGWHSGESRYVFLDTHVQQAEWGAKMLVFVPPGAAARQEIPVQGRLTNQRTQRPLSSTFVIFSKSPRKVTSGSVWPSSFTDKAGRFQSILYPGKNYLMVLINNRFTAVGATQHETEGNSGRITTQGMRIGPPGAPASEYDIRLSLPESYTLEMNTPTKTGTERNSMDFVPVVHIAARHRSR